MRQITSKIILLSILTLPITFTSCEKEEESPEETMTVTVSGVVSEFGTQTLVQRAIVSINNTFDTTDENGAYTLSNIPSGSQTIQVETETYSLYIETIEVPTSDFEYNIVLIDSGTGFDCPSLQSNIGDPCDDGNSETINDTVNSECSCQGNMISDAEYPSGSVHCIEGGALVVEVLNPTTGKVWMDRNLGASQVANSRDDELAFGDLYQWGRFSDGHQCRDSETTSSVSSTPQPGHGDFIILSSGAPWNWLNPQNDNLWQGVNGVNNPCPAEYRLPTEAELDAERESWSSNDSAGAFDSPLKFTSAGARNGSNGSLVVGSYGHYWSGAVSGTIARRLTFDHSLAGMYDSSRALGYTVRCIKD